MVLKNSSFSCYSCFRCSFFTITLKVRKMLACRAVSSITITPVSVDWRQSNRWMLRLSVNLFAWFSLESKREDWEPGTRVRLVLLFFMLCEKKIFFCTTPTLTYAYKVFDAWKYWWFTVTMCWLFIYNFCLSTAKKFLCCTHSLILVFFVQRQFKVSLLWYQNQAIFITSDSEWWRQFK